MQRPPLLTSAREELIGSVSARLAKRRASAFSSAGEAACQALVEATVDALERDVEADQRSAMREAVEAVFTEIEPADMSFSDLRFFVSKLRRAVLDAASDAARVSVEQWCFEFFGVCTTRFVVEREHDLEHQSAQRDIARAEFQLAELKIALADKTALLERIREVSTPIAPVAPGVLLVPLVGTFDRFRAELLTERLLAEISRAKTRSVILDIAGVPMFDTDGAELVVRLTRCARLLGARVLLVGISPQNARAIVSLNVDLGQLTTCANLQEGLARAQGR